MPAREQTQQFPTTSSCPRDSLISHDDADDNEEDNSLLIAKGSAAGQTKRPPISEDERSKGFWGSLLWCLGKCFSSSEREKNEGVLLGPAVALAGTAVSVSMMPGRRRERPVVLPKMRNGRRRNRRTFFAGDRGDEGPPYPVPAAFRAVLISVEAKGGSILWLHSPFVVQIKKGSSSRVFEFV